MFVFAQFISAISNPIIFAFPASYALVYKTTLNSYLAFVWGIVSFLVAFIVALFVIYGVHRKIFSDFDISQRNQRAPLFIFASIVILLYAMFIFIFNGPRVLFVGLTGVALGIFCDSIINTRIKASIHVATYSAFAVGIALLYGGYFELLVVLIPVVAWARVKVRRHSIQETVIGVLLGISIVAIMYLLISLLV